LLLTNPPSPIHHHQSSIAKSCCIITPFVSLVTHQSTISNPPWQKAVASNTMFNHLEHPVTYGQNSKLMQLINTCHFEDAEIYLHNCKYPSYWVNSRSGNGLAILNIAILRKAPIGIISLLVEKGGNNLCLLQDN
jgi:hypothetical protein